MTNISELTPIHDNRKSFYKKALIEYTEDGQKLLYSYNTLVAKIQNNKAVVFDTYSPTTLRHIKEFLLQSGFTAENKKQIENDYKKA